MKFPKKRLISTLLAGVFLLNLTACGKSESNPSDIGNADSAQKRTASLFDTYVSNTVIATGSNTAVPDAQSITYRAWIPTEVSGAFEYCFYFSNVIDSTWDDGSDTHAGMSGGAFTIERASVADGGTVFDANISPETSAAVTFSGNASKDVAPDEVFWSDPVDFDVPDGHYLLWEWTVTGTTIPATRMSNLAYAYADSGDGKGFIYTNEIPLPKLFGCKRENTTRIVTLGDSVTQGCGTTDFETQFWAAQLLEQLGTENYSLWNLGLGYARGTDCATEGDWLNRAAASADIVTIAYGINDIISGPYGENRHASADEIETAVRTVAKPFQTYGIETILWNIPPFDLSAELEPIRLEYNEKATQIASDCGATLFDAAELLKDPADASKTVYGQHPDDTGCAVIADALTELLKTNHESEAIS